MELVPFFINRMRIYRTILTIIALISAVSTYAENRERSQMAADAGKRLTVKEWKTTPDGKNSWVDHIEVYNEIIRDCVKEAGVKLADLAAQGVTYESFNRLHPDEAGMTTFAEAWVKNLKGEI